MSWESSLSFFAAIFVFSITPGPGVFAIIAKALVNGSKSCLYLSLGMAVSDVVYLIAACFGLAAIATHWGGLFTVIRVVGALYLLYLGWKMWHAPLNLEDGNKSSEPTKRMKNFIQGFMISASNPKVILFYIAFLPTFIDLTQLSRNDIFLVSGITMTSLMLGLMCVATFAAKARMFFQSESSVKRLNRSAGSIMMSAGAFLLLRS